MRPLFIALGFLFALLTVTAQAADEPRIVRVPGPGGSELEVAIYGEDGKRHPLLLFNHGSPVDGSDRKTLVARYGTPARWLAKRGFIVAVPTRRGYGNSTGRWAEDFGRCDRPDFVNAANATVADFRATIDYMAGQPNVDASKVVLVGHSAGGWGSISGDAARLPGIVAIVNFAGGRGGDPKRGFACNETELVRAAGTFGAANRVPSLWIYAENDLFFRPELAGKLVEAYSKAGGQVTFIKAPASGKDGHGYYNAAPPDKSWGPAVTAFLGKILPLK